MRTALSLITGTETMTTGLNNSISSFLIFDFWVLLISLIIVTGALKNLKINSNDPQNLIHLVVHLSLIIGR